MSTGSLLYKDDIRVTDNISIIIPKVGDVIDHEDEYYSIVSSLTAMPIDRMVELDDVGIDFTEINDYDLFLMTFPQIAKMDTSLVFGDLDLTKFDMAVNEENKMVVMYNDEDNIIIDRVVQLKIAATLRELHHLEKNRRKPGNKEAQRYLIERARKKAARNRKRKKQSQIESLIVAMVNTEEFKYNYETVRDLSIYQFNESVRQIIKKVDYNNKMHGVYSGTVDVKGMDKEEFNWLSHK